MTCGSRAISAGVPSASRRPRSSTTMRSDASITRRMLCSTSTTVVPSAVSSRISVSISRASVAFSPAAGSSSSSTRGSAASARAISRRFSAPYGMVSARAARWDARPTRSSSRVATSRHAASARARAGVRSIAESIEQRSCRWRPVMTFSSAVMLKNTCRFWNVRPMPAAA